MAASADRIDAAITAAAEMGVSVDADTGAGLADHRAVLKRRAERIRALLTAADEPGRLDLRQPPAA